MTAGAPAAMGAARWLIHYNIVCSIARACAIEWLGKRLSLGHGWSAGAGGVIWLEKMQLPSRAQGYAHSRSCAAKKSG